MANIRLEEPPPDNNPKPIITYHETNVYGTIEEAIRSLADFNVPNEIIELHLARTIYSNVYYGDVEQYDSGRNRYLLRNVHIGLLYSNVTLYGKFSKIRSGTLEKFF